MSEVKNFAAKLLTWRKAYGRQGLPWQNEKDPYKVWLSEIMLQQTQVLTVIERYHSFLKRFPNIDVLAKSSQDDVLHEWAGLGYYTRARNLHRCAQIIHESLNSEFPKKAEELEQLPGIGRSTAAAIAAFCFEERVSILDGNVKRLLSRVFGIRSIISQVQTEKKLLEIAESMLPKNKKDMPAYTQALMDFGATVCKPKQALCLIDKKEVRKCIYQNICFAYREDQVELIPQKIKKEKTKEVMSEMLLIVSKGHVLLEKKSGEGIWGGLWSLPETKWVDKNEESNFELAMYDAISKIISKKQYQIGKIYTPRRHVFTHRILYFQVRQINIENKNKLASEDWIWCPIEDLKGFGYPKPIKELLSDFFNLTQ